MTREWIHTAGGFHPDISCKEWDTFWHKQARVLQFKGNDEQFSENKH